MRLRRAHQHDVDLVRARQVVGKPAVTGQQPIILDTLDVLSLAEHRHMPRSS
jgi:hypothetical protein